MLNRTHMRLRAKVALRQVYAANGRKRSGPALRSTRLVCLLRRRSLPQLVDSGDPRPSDPQGGFAHELALAL